MSPHNVRRQWRQARADTGLEWVTPHTFRKTVATLIDKEADAKSAAAQLGHASEDVTNAYYIVKPALARTAPTSSNSSAPARRQPPPSAATMGRPGQRRHARMDA
jgi:integrase